MTVSTNLRRFFVFLLCTVSALLCFKSVVVNAEKNNEKHIKFKSENEKSAFEDKVKEQLPRIPHKEPNEALETFEVHPKFELQLIASEPLIRDPVALDIDENGLMYVVEMPAYNLHDNENYKNLGAIKLLEDTDNDGTYDKSTVFLDGLYQPTAVACYGGGVFVGVVPDILFCKDTDGDGKADIKRKILTGFNRDEAGEALLNSFRWGLDNKFHISTSLAGGSVKKADDENSEPVSVRNRGLLFNPRNEEFDVTSGAGQHGMSMDDWGRKFVCGNSQPIHLLMYDDRYLRRNKYLRAPRPAINIAPDGKYTQLYRTSPVEPWRILRQRWRTEGIVKGASERGTASGSFSAATGVTIYRGDAWPKEFHGQVFVGEVASNLIYRANLESKGVELVAHRADQKKEFISSSDNWFRPAQFVNAPDGNLMVIDMYRELIETVVSIPPEITKYLDATSGTDRGRIYRIAPKGYKFEGQPKLGSKSDKELIALFEHPNGWHRDTASRLIYERQSKESVPMLRSLGETSKSPIARMMSLHSLNALGAISKEDLERGLRDESPKVQEHTLRIAESYFNQYPDLEKLVTGLVDIPDMMLQYQLAFTIGELKNNDLKVQLLRKILLANGQDSWIRLAVLSSLAGIQTEFLAKVSQDKEFIASKEGRVFLSELISMIGASRNQQALLATTRQVEQLYETNTSAARSATVLLLRQLSVYQANKLLKAAGKKFNAIHDSLIETSLQIVLNPEQSPQRRVSSMKVLRTASWDDITDVVEECWTERQPNSVQAAAIDLIGEQTHADVSSMLIEKIPGFGPKVTAQAIETLLSRSAWAKAFLSAIVENKISRGMIDNSRLTLLSNHPDKAIQATAKLLLKSGSNKARSEVVAKYRKALELKGDESLGKAAFKKNCSACHQLEGVGQIVGPDLKSIKNRGMESIILNVFDPNRDLKPQYHSYVLILDGGKVISGMIANETANSITIRQPDGKQLDILRNQILQMKSTGLSFMPEGLEKDISVKAMADLLAYLQSV